MWEKLLGLFKDSYGEDSDYIPASIAKRDARKQQLETINNEQVNNFKNKSINQLDKGTLIGFDYLKGLKDDEDTLKPRRFDNLNRLLRGDYKDGKIEATTRETSEDIRRKNSQ